MPHYKRGSRALTGGKLWLPACENPATHVQGPVNFSRAVGACTRRRGHWTNWRRHSAISLSWSRSRLDGGNSAVVTYRFGQGTRYAVSSKSRAATRV